MTVRAARSIFADLELLDAVPEPLHEPMLRTQLEHYDLALERQPDYAEVHANRGALLMRLGPK